MTIEEYLSGGDAVRDVAARAATVKFDADGEATQVMPWPQPIFLSHEMHANFTPGPWVSIWIACKTDEGDEVQCMVYFRPDGDRYVVTDLGVAVRALRLRTGCLTHPAQMARVPWRITDVLGCLNGLDFHWAGDALTVENVPAADLPRAICAVLLAAYRVSRLDVPHG